MTEISYLEARQRILADPAIGPILGWYGTATTVSGLQITDPVNLGGSARNVNFFKGQGRVVFPGRNENDRERDAEALEWGGAGTLNLSGPALGFSATNEYYEFWRRGFRPIRVLQAWQKALWDVYAEEVHPVSQILVDGSCEEQDYGAWVESHSDLTFTFSPAAAHNLHGYYALLLTFGGAVDTRYLTQAANFYLTEGEEFWLAANVKLVEGPGPIYFDVYNEDTGVRLEQQVVATGAGRWYHVGGRYRANAAGNYNVRIGAAHGSTVAVAGLPNHLAKGTHWNLPERIDQNFKLRRIDEFHYSRTLDTYWEDAQSRSFRSWKHRQEYATETLEASANPGSVQLLPRPGQREPSMPMCDLYYRSLRLVGDFAVIDENTPVPVDETMILTAFKYHMLDMIQEVRPSDRWGPLQRGMQNTLDSQRKVTEEETHPYREPSRRHMSA